MRKLQIANCRLKIDKIKVVAQLVEQKCSSIARDMLNKSHKCNHYDMKSIDITCYAK